METPLKTPEPREKISLNEVIRNTNPNLEYGVPLETLDNTQEHRSIKRRIHAPRRTHDLGDNL